MVYYGTCKGAKSVDKAGMTIDQIDHFELNEAFSVVGLAMPRFWTL